VSFRHNLLKEIYEQPKAIIDTLAKSHDKVRSLVHDKPMEDRIIFIGMGSSYFASIYAKYLFSNLPKMNVDAISAAEFLHYIPYVEDKTLIFAMSQSGESIETVKVVKELKKKSFQVWCITNSAISNLATLSDEALLTYAGEEKCSATKTFLATIALLYVFWIKSGIKRGYFPDEHDKKATRKLARMARIIADRLDLWNDLCRGLASRVNNANSLIVLSRGYNLCAALQGSLLFKEVSKIHAEAVMGGDFRHGPIELTNPKLLIISLAAGRTKQLMHRIAKEVKTLGGDSILITDDKSIITDGDILVDKIDEPLSPILFTVPLELIAYNSAILKGRNPDSPQYMSKITRIE